MLLPATAALADKKAGAGPAAIDVAPVAGKLAVYKDDAGMYYVVPALAFGDDADKWVFYGNAKGMYQQRVIGSGSSPDNNDFSVWAPRAKGIQQGGLAQKADALTVSCTAKDGKPLPRVNADEAKLFLSHTKFYAPMWQRQAHFLARDEEGTYYYVDALQEDYGGKGYRVFVGQKGAMKEMPMTSVVSDSAGEIFATKTGELKIVTGADGKAYWKKSGVREELVVLEPYANKYLIYRDLGIYGTLGAICDDQ
jgi:hypothetical protein